jgi:hypothetical protein
MTDIVRNADGTFTRAYLAERANWERRRRRRKAAAAGGSQSDFSPLLNFGEESASTAWYTSTQFNALYDAAVDKTFVAQEEFFQPPSKRFSVVKAFNHATLAWAQAYNVGAQSALTDDDHGAPAIALNADGRLVCAWGNHDGNFHLAVSTNPHDEKTWTAAADLVGAYAYPHLVLLPSGTMVCLLRKNFAPGTGGFTNGAKTFVYRPITFVGAVATIGAEVVIGDMGDDSRWYQGTAILRPDGYIHQVCTRANFNDDVRLNAYYYKIDIAGARFLSVNNTAVAFPITNTNMTNTFKIYTTGGSNTSNTPVLAFDTDGRRHVVTHEGGTTDGGGSNAAPQTLKYLLASAADTAFTGPTDVGASTQRYNSEILVPLPAGKMRLIWNKDKNNLNLRGGAVQCRELAQNAAATAFGTEFTLMDHDVAGGRGALSAVVAPLFADEDIRALWCEIGLNSLDVNAGPKKVYAWGDGGMRSKAKPTYVAPPAFTGDGFFLDLHDNTHIFSDAAGTVVCPVDTEIRRVTDGNGNGNLLDGAAGTGPILRSIGGKLALGFGGASAGTRFLRSTVAKSWTAGNGYMFTAIMRHWMPSTVSLTLASLDAGVGFARAATLVNTNGRQLRAIAFNGTASTIVAGGAAEHEYANDYIVQSYTVGANIHLYVNGVLVQTLPISGGLINTSSVVLTIGATSAAAATGFFMGACFGAILRTGDQTTQTRDADLAWAMTQLPK